ncbi:MAG TPA: PhzF family phenazine biosynthesis protein [Puia sp.]|jgi:PhzF family phenazine biosynthesis protein
MMELKIYIANAFAGDRFGGNPAAVVPLQDWLSDELMQQIAAQNNLAETAFIVPQGNDFAIRWFTPTVEVALCGHATLASAHIFFRHLGYGREQIRFHSGSGPLLVSKRPDGKLTLDFPADEPVPADSSAFLEQGLKVKPIELYKSSFDYLAILDGQDKIERLSPDFGLLAKLPSRGVIVSAKGDQSDFVSRCFFPQSGIDEDPVTGSAHTVMVPYWAARLGKSALTAVQLSKRRGYLDCALQGDRVLMSGQAFTYLAGEIYI